MKYTNYLLNKDYVNVENIKTDTIYLKPISDTFSIIGAVGGLCIIGGLIPMTLMYDGLRSVKYEYIKFNRKQIHLN